MSKFKVGDEVKVIKNAYGAEKVGSILTINEINGTTIWDFYTRTKMGVKGFAEYCNYDFDDLELVKEKSPSNAA